MKSKLLVIIAFVVSSIAIGQTKVGTVNSEYVIGKMPQMKAALVRLDTYGKKLDSTYLITQKAYQSKVENFKATQASLSEAATNTEIQGLASLEDDMQKFRKNGATMMQIRREEFMRPLYKKLSETITEIAKANGYTQILTSSGNEFGYIDERFDITKLVLDKLGIKE